MKLIIKIFFVSLIIINNSNSQKINCETYDDYFKNILNDILVPLLIGEYLKRKHLLKVI